MFGIFTARMGMFPGIKIHQNNARVLGMKRNEKIKVYMVLREKDLWLMSPLERVLFTEK